jgi:hypothetical protein
MADPNAIIGGGTATTATVPAPKIPSSCTNPFDNDLDLSTKEGISIWNRATQIDPTSTRLDLIVDNGDKILTEIQTKVSEYRLARHVRIPLNGDGIPIGTRTGTSITNFTGHKKLLENYHELTLEDVQAFACYNWGDNTATRRTVPNFVCQALDFTTPTGLSLARIKQKHQFRIHSEMLFKILSNLLTKDAMQLLMVEKDKFSFEDTETGDEKYDGVILLKMILDDVKPSVVIDVQDLEDLLVSTTLQKHGNNVQTLTREMEKTYKER